MSDFTYVGSELETFRLARNWKSYFAEQLRPYIRGSTAEVGAGIGTSSPGLWNPSVTAWLCIEPDSTLASALSSVRLGPDEIQPEVVVGMLESVESDRRFDTILYIDVLEHIADDRHELELAARHLAPGGRIIVLSPAYQWLYSAFDQAIGHFRRYTAQTLASLAPSDCTCEATWYADSVGLLASAANKLALRQTAATVGQVQFWDGRLVPISRLLDRATGRRIGRSVIAIFRKSLESPRP